jgi:hypothetical protein
MSTTAASSESTLRQVADVLEIQQLFYKYVIAVDSRQPELLLDCFTDDARIQLAGTVFESPKDLVSNTGNVLEGFDATQHDISAPLVQVEGDVAFSRCYFTAQHVRNSLAPDAFLLVGGTYDDELVRTQDGWRITKRLGTPSWMQGNPEVLNLRGMLSIPGSVGALDRTAAHACPSWLLRSSR